jgi:hypothetical protein
MFVLSNKGTLILNLIRLLAIMLVKLRMSVEEATDEFGAIVEAVYANKLNPTEKTEKLRKCMEALLTKRKLPVDLMLEDEKQDGRCVGYDSLDSLPGLIIKEPTALFWQLIAPTFRTRSTSGPIPYDVLPRNRSQ